MIFRCIRLAQSVSLPDNILLLDYVRCTPAIFFLILQCHLHEARHSACCLAKYGEDQAQSENGIFHKKYLNLISKQLILNNTKNPWLFITAEIIYQRQLGKIILDTSPETSLTVRQTFPLLKVRIYTEECSQT